GDYDPIRLASGLDAFVEWRSEVGEAGSPASLCWAIRGDRFEVAWHEPAAGGLSRPDPPQAGPDPLALPLLARVITAHGGNTALDVGDGLRIEASWPCNMHHPR